MMRMLLLGILCMVLITEYSGMEVDNCNNIYVLSGHLISAIIQEYNNNAIDSNNTIIIQENKIVKQITFFYVQAPRSVDLNVLHHQLTRRL